MGLKILYNVLITHFRDFYESGENVKSLKNCVSQGLIC